MCKILYHRAKDFFLDFPTGHYMLKTNNRNTKKRCEICWKLTIKTPKQRHIPFWSPKGGGGGSKRNIYIIDITAEYALLNNILNELKFPISLAKDSKADISHILEEYERFNTCVLRPVNCVILWLIRFVFLATECQFNFCTFFPIPSSVSRYFKTENECVDKAV